MLVRLQKSFQAVVDQPPVQAVLDALRAAKALNCEDRQRSARDTRLAQLHDLNVFEDRVYSQNGEDGIIRELFTRIPCNRLFVEIGVEDGLECNTALLSREYGWRGLMIEGSPTMYEKLRVNYEALPVKCVQAMVRRETASELLASANTPVDFDLLSIDIDGNDFFIWEALRSYRPRVVVIEYNSFYGPDVALSIAYDPEHVYRGRDQYFGASLAALATLGNRLGYALIGTERTGVNAFFVRRDLLPQCGFPELSPQNAWRPKSFTRRLLPGGSGPYFHPD